ncbi:MAG: acyl-ACP--UDP-N-acetylglucosamine O-acyltransferase [Akkermansiaceae bacterium]|jgi:UDP-N-acetylglucosamine acyltransferase
MPNIHPSALVSPSANLADDVEVGAFAIIEDEVVIGSGCKIGSQAKIRKGVVMGENNTVDHGSVIGGDPQDLSFDPETPSGVVIGNGNTFREHVTINRSTSDNGNTIVGDDNFLMAVAHLGHDTLLGDHNVLANNVMIAGHCRIGNRTFLGGGAATHQFVHVGDFVMAQGNSGMTRDVPPYCIVHQINQLSGLNTVGLKRGGFSPEERKEIKAAYALVLNSKTTRIEALATADKISWGPAAAKLIEAVRHPSSKGILTR